MPRQDLTADRSTPGLDPDGTSTSAARALAFRIATMWRMVRLAVHIVRGALTLQLSFPRLAPAQRHEHVANWSLGVLQLLRIDLRTQGELPAGPKLLVANHVSWLDIVVIHALCPQARFVSKAVVGDWPLIGRLVTGAGTLMVDRQRQRDAARVLQVMVRALNDGDTVALFPEGTTSDGAKVLDFHPSLLQSAVIAAVPVQPVALRYAEAGQAPSPSVPYIGTTSFVESLWRTCAARQLAVTVWLPDAAAPPHTDRRTLARELRCTIVAALDGAPNAGL